MFLQQVGDLARQVGGGLLDQARSSIGEARNLVTDPAGFVGGQFNEMFADPEEVRKKKMARFQQILDGTAQGSPDEIRELQAMGLMPSTGRQIMQPVYDFMGGLLGGRNG